MHAKARELFAPGHRLSFFAPFSPHFSTREGGQEFHVRFPSKLSEDLSGLSEALSVPPPLLYYFLSATRNAMGIQCKGADVDKCLPITLSHPTSLSFSSFSLSLPSTSTCSHSEK